MEVVIQEVGTGSINHVGLFERQFAQVRVVISLAVITIKPPKSVLLDARRHSQQIVNGYIGKGWIAHSQLG